MKGIKITVSSYSGYAADERPLAFIFGEKKYNIVEIIDRWYGPDHRYFKVRADDGNEYIMRYDNARDEWELDFFQKIK